MWVLSAGCESREMRSCLNSNSGKIFLKVVYCIWWQVEQKECGELFKFPQVYWQDTDNYKNKSNLVKCVQMYNQKPRSLLRAEAWEEVNPQTHCTRAAESQLGLFAKKHISMLVRNTCDAPTAASECLNTGRRVCAALAVAAVVVKTSLKLAKPRRATPRRQEVFLCLLISTQLFPEWKKKPK